MTDLYILNEISANQPEAQKHSYQNQSTTISSLNIFIKAINKATDKIKESVALLPEIGDPKATALERDSEQTKALVAFVSNLDLASKIVDEFQKSLSIIPQDIAELAGVFESINNAFSGAQLMINMFSVTKNIKYSEDAKSLLENILNMFEQMKESL